MVKLDGKVECPKIGSKVDVIFWNTRLGWNQYTKKHMKTKVKGVKGDILYKKSVYSHKAVVGLS